MPINRPNVYGAGAATNTELYADAARGLLGDKVRLYSLYGYNEDVDTTSEPIAPDGSRRNVVSGDFISEVKSTSASDASGQLGAVVIHIEGIKKDGTKGVEDVTLNGTNEVLLSNEYAWLNSAVVKTAGALSTNAGEIQFLDTDGSIVGRIGAATGALAYGGIAYPANHTAIVKDLTINVSRNPTVPFGNAHLTIQLVHAQSIQDGTPNVTTNILWQRKVTFTTSNANVNVYNIENEIIVPPYYKQKDGGQAEAGVLYLQASSTGSNQHVYVGGNVLVTAV